MWSVKYFVYIVGSNILCSAIIGLLLNIYAASIAFGLSVLVRVGALWWYSRKWCARFILDNPKNAAIGSILANEGCIDISPLFNDESAWTALKEKYSGAMEEINATFDKCLEDIVAAEVIYQLYDTQHKIA